MKKIEFQTQRACPACRGLISSAALEPKYDPVVVVICPHCAKLLWRPGIDQDGPLYIFDPEADSGGI